MKGQCKVENRLGVKFRRVDWETYVDIILYDLKILQPPYQVTEAMSIYFPLPIGNYAQVSNRMDLISFLVKEEYAFPMMNPILKKLHHLCQA